MKNSFELNTGTQYSFKINVRCGILNDQIVEPVIFIKTFNIRCLEMFQTFLSDYLENRPPQARANIYFQQDRTSVHSTPKVRTWLNKGGRGADRIKLSKFLSVLFRMFDFLFLTICYSI